MRPLSSAPALIRLMLGKSKQTIVRTGPTSVVVTVKSEDPATHEVKNIVFHPHGAEVRAGLVLVLILYLTLPADQIQLEQGWDLHDGPAVRVVRQDRRGGEQQDPRDGLGLASSALMLYCTDLIEINIFQFDTFLRKTFTVNSPRSQNIMKEHPTDGPAKIEITG